MQHDDVPTVPPDAVQPAAASPPTLASEDASSPQAAPVQAASAEASPPPDVELEEQPPTSSETITRKRRLMRNRLESIIRRGYAAAKKNCKYVPAAATRAEDRRGLANDVEGTPDPSRPHAFAPVGRSYDRAEHGRDPRRAPRRDSCGCRVSIGGRCGRDLSRDRAGHTRQASRAARRDHGLALLSGHVERRRPENARKNDPEQFARRAERRTGVAPLADRRPSVHAARTGEQQRTSAAFRRCGRGDRLARRATDARRDRAAPGVRARGGAARGR